MALGAPESLDESTKARWLESARQYAGLLHRLEGKKAALVASRQAAQKALAQPLDGVATRYLQAQLRMADLSLKLLSALPLDEKVATPVPELLGPTVQAMQVELQWCQLSMEGAFLLAAWPWLQQDLPPKAEAPDGAPEGWLALRAQLLTRPEALEACQRAAQALPPFIEVMAQLEEGVAYLRTLPTPQERREAWHLLGVAPAAGLAYRVASPLRQVPGLHEAWLAWRQAWVASLVPPATPQKAKPSLGTRQSKPTRRLTDRLSAPLGAPLGALIQPISQALGLSPSAPLKAPNHPAAGPISPPLGLPGPLDGPKDAPSPR